MKKIGMLCLVLLPMIASAQGGGNSKIMKEIEIAENILSSLLQQEMEATEDVIWVGASNRNSNVEGTYIDNFGALFTIGGSSSRFRSFSFGDGSFSSNYNFDLNGVAKIKGRRPYVIQLDSDGRKKKDKEEENPDEEVVTESFNSFEFFKKVSRDFFVDYGYLIKGVKPSEKVLIRYIQKSDIAIVLNGWDQGQSENIEKVYGNNWEEAPGVYTAMVLKSDIDALQKGNLSEAQFEKKIAYTEGEADASAETKDMKLINSIFSRLYKEDLSGGSCIISRGTPRSEYIPELGLVVNMRMNTRCRSWKRSFGNGLELFREGQNGVVILGGDDEDEQADKKEVEQENPDEHYPAFLATLKENIVEYGSIAKSLQSDEVLVFKVSFSGCRDCQLIPENISITATQSTLTAYRQGKLSLEKAVEQLKTVE